MTSIVIGILVVLWIVSRQLTARPVRERSALRLVLVLLVIGVLETSDAVKGVSVPPTAWALVALGLGVGAALGYVRARSVRIWRADDGSAMAQGHALTVALWVVSIAIHVGLDVWVDHVAPLPDGRQSLGYATLLLFLAVTIGIQREVTRQRAARELPARELPTGEPRQARQARNVTS